MLTLLSQHGDFACDRVSRRDFLRIGSLGLGGLTLPGWLAAQAEAGTNIARDKSVILLFLSGGASHIETFDPKMTAPVENRSMTGELATTIPGVTFGGTFERLSRLAQQMSVVRSFKHPITDHVSAIVHMLTAGTDATGKGKEGYSLGSLVSRLRGANHPHTGMPTYALLTAEENDRQYSSERGRVQRGSLPGVLGQAYAPFDPAGGSEAVRNMRLSLSPERLDDRRGLLKSLDSLNRAVDASGMMEGVDKFHQQAVDVVLRGAAKAFDLSQEDPRTVERYDTSHIRIGHNKYRQSTLGQQLLLARRLCEAGCGFITIHSAGWDMHADGNNPGILAGMNGLGRSVDVAVSALIEDLEQRGLSEKVLLIVTGDFGRTPKINKRGGRDHWANLCTLALAGGGLKMGQVIGQSSRDAGTPATDPFGPANLMATVIHTLFDVPKLRLQTGVPRELVKSIEEGQPIPQLF